MNVDLHEDMCREESLLRAVGIAFDGNLNVFVITALTIAFVPVMIFQ